MKRSAVSGAAMAALSLPASFQPRPQTTETGRMDPDDAASAKTIRADMEGHSNKPSFLTQLEMVVKGGRVKRFHAKSLVKDENVAEHSYSVAWLAWMVSEGNPSLKLIMACLSHDMPEHVTGDIPSPVKRLQPGLKEAMSALEDKLFGLAGIPNFERELDAPDSEVLAFCDNFSGWLKCLYERRLGNLTLVNTETRYKDYLYALLADAQYLDTALCREMIDTVTARGVPV